jgi:serine protease
MVRRIAVLATLAALGVATFALAPAAPERQLPETPAPAAASGGGILAVDLVDGSDRAALDSVAALLGAELDWAGPHAVDEALAQGWVADLAGAAAALAGDPRVEVVEPVLEMEAFGYPNDPMYEQQWHLREMGAPVGWEESPRGKGVIVAVIDTGVTVVEDLEGTHVLTGASMVPGEPGAADGNGHGTHVAGTIAQTTNNGIGVAGVAPEATILPVKVLSKYGSGMSTWIAAGIDYAVDEGADVINLSLGGSYSAIIHNAVKKAEKKGVIVVAAAGNGGREGVSYPGALVESIGVSAVGPGGGLAPYSSWGKGVDIAAPGGDKTKAGGGVFQNTIDGKGGEVYGEFQGTSMATPHVAGAAAILLSTGMAPEAVKRTLLSTADGDAWDAKLGHGRLDLAAAVHTAEERQGATLFGLGLLVALLMGQLAGVGGRFRAASAAVGGLVAGGIFFLDQLPVPGGLLTDLLGTSVLYWPAMLGWPDLTHFPLWLSAALPAAMAFSFGAWRPTRPLALGVAAGIGAHLLHGAATSTLAPWGLSGMLGTSWLIGHAAVCGLLAMALAGVEKLEAGQKS